MNDTLTFPEWYRSTQGPHFSSTLTNIVLSFLPMINFMLMSRGIQLFPEQINFWVSALVFLFFSVKSAIGYIRAKRTLWGVIQDQNKEIVVLSGMPKIKVE